MNADIRASIRGGTAEHQNNQKRLSIWYLVPSIAGRSQDPAVEMVHRPDMTLTPDHLRGQQSRRDLIRRAMLLLPWFQGLTAGAKPSPAHRLRIVDRWSPLNKRRPVRPSTLFVVLHTTEGAEEGSLAKVRKYGETHYFVGINGTIYRVIDRKKIATHAGRSLWDGHRALDNCAVAVEIAGYHDRDITPAQYAALKELVRQLKAAYKITDGRVLTHSMVAYGRPNRYHHAEHRGRKRCGMLFAKPEVRIALGLDPGPLHDRDVEAGRLAVADRQLFALLYARPPARPLEDIEPAAEESSGGTNGGEQGFEGFQEIGKEGVNAREIAGAAYDDERTIYFFANGLIRTGKELARSRRYRSLLENPPTGTRLLVGYVYGGYVQSRRPPSRIAGARWNYPSTFYRLPDGKILSGDEIDDSGIPERTLIFYQR